MRSAKVMVTLLACLSLSRVHSAQGKTDLTFAYIISVLSWSGMFEYPRTRQRLCHSSPRRIIFCQAKEAATSSRFVFYYVLPQVTACSSAVYLCPCSCVSVSLCLCTCVSLRVYVSVFESTFVSARCAKQVYLSMRECVSM